MQSSQQKKMKEQPPKPETLNQKQDYLSKHILDEGYDPEQFQDFMLHYSNKQLDLNLWTVNELKNIVQKFQNKKKYGEVQEQQLTEIEKQKIMKQRQQEGDDENRKSMSMLQHQIEEQKNNKKQDKSQGKNPDSKSMNSSNYHYFNFKKKQILPQLYILAHVQRKPLSISIPTYSKTTPNNIFKSSYIEYHIHLSPEKWETKRRYQDFKWLQQYLSKKYEGLPIPPLPQKTTIRSFDEKHIEYRMMMLQQFLNMLLQMPQICSEPIVQIFVRGNNEYFGQAKKQYQEKLDRSQGDTNLESIFGPDLVLMDQHSIEQPIINFYKQYTNKLTNLSMQLNNVIQSMRKVEGQLFEISSSYQELQSLLEGSVKGSSLMGVLQQYCNGLAMHISKSTDYLKQQLYSPWNYQSMYSESLLSNLVKCQKQHQHMTQKYKTALLKLPQESPPSSSGTSPSPMQQSKQIKEYQMVKQIYRIRLSYVVRQTRRYEQEQMLVLVKEWNQAIRTYVNSVGEWMIGCTDNLTKSMSVGEGKKLVEVQYIGGVKSAKKDNKEKGKEKVEQEQSKDKEKNKEKGKEKDKDKDK